MKALKVKLNITNYGFGTSKTESTIKTIPYVGIGPPTLHAMQQDTNFLLSKNKQAFATGQKL